jgi:uncharacterized protein (TIGR02145 family)
MVKILTLLLMLSAASAMQAQNFQVTFSASGQSSVVSTVTVSNLSSGTSLTMSGSDTLELIVGSGFQGLVGEPGELHIYPNPVHEVCVVQFDNPEFGNVNLRVCDLSGNIAFQTESLLPAGIQIFHIHGLRDGLYIVQLKTGFGMNTAKIISLGNAQEQSNSISASLEHINNLSIAKVKPEKGQGMTQMPYAIGDHLLFTGVSGIFSRNIVASPTQGQVIHFEFVDCSDGDSNHYSVVTIGTQTWMSENLRATKFDNGNAIPLVTNSSQWGNASMSAVCWYFNDSASYGNAYGALYNWFTVQTGHLCPVGWHIPENSEFDTLALFLGGSLIAGGKLKETGILHWENPNTGASNETGFTALPGGYRESINGSFDGAGISGNWWSLTGYSANEAWGYTLGYSDSDIFKSNYSKITGFSVRCIRD